MTEVSTERSAAPGAVDALTVHDAAVPPLPGRVVLLLAVALLLLAGGVFVLGWLPRLHRQDTAARIAARHASEPPVVETLSPQRGAAAVELLLPGDVRADRATSVFARTSGYLQQLGPGIDIGARVVAGQLLAVLSAPELDAELARARADRLEAEAARQRARDDQVFQTASFARFKGYAQEGGLTTQQLEERQQQLDAANSGLASAEANATAAAATQQRLEELVAYERVVAPFDGVITYRGYDIGAVIASAEVGAGKELFRIVAANVIRVRVAVPQVHAAAIKLGQSAEVLLRDGSNRTVSGTVARSAGAVDATTRTMAVEIDVANADGSILPGTYGRVRLQLQRQHPGWLLPASALMVGAAGTQIAQVVDGRVQLRTISIDNDQGTSVEVLEGFDGNEQIIDNPGASTSDGLAVTVRAREKPPEQAR